MPKLKVKKRNSVSDAIKSKRKKDELANHSLIEKQCRCGNIVKNVNATIIDVVCWECVQKALPAPEIKVKKEKVDTGFPRGWKWMKQFVHNDGRVFENGIENKKLKGTLEPTPPKPKLSKKEKELKQLEKDKKLAQKFAKKQKIKEKKQKQKQKLKKLK